MRQQDRSILLNGISVGSGGGLTVAHELSRALAIVRPHWRVTTLYCDPIAIHHEAKQKNRPPNHDLHFHPATSWTALQRWRYERTQLPRWIQEQRFDACVQLNGMIFGDLGVPTIIHFQDPWPYRPSAWTSPTASWTARVKRWLHRRAIKRCDLATFTSGYLRKTICESNHLSVQGEVLYNGIPDEWITTGEAVATGDRKLQVVTISDVNDHKRQSLVIEAMASLIERPKLSNLTYHIAGNFVGDIKIRLANQIAALGLQDHVVLEGRVSDQRVIELLSQSRASVLMSVCESFGIPCIEAMARGCPILVSDCCALPEVVGDPAGIVPEDDVQSLVDRLERTLTDDAFAQELVDHGLRRCRDFRWTASGENLASWIDQLCERTGD